jgi:hypothetical protein
MSSALFIACGVSERLTIGRATKYQKTLSIMMGKSRTTKTHFVQDPGARLVGTEVGPVVVVVAVGVKPGMARTQ